MNRRSFLAAAMVAAATPPAPAAPEPALRAVHRYDYATGTWTRCRLFHIRAGDVFRFDEDPSLVAQCAPFQDDDGVWCIHAEFRIDSATNQWVPVTSSADC